MADLFDMFETSDELENDGVWLNFGSAKILIARNGGSNIEWMKMYTDELKKLGKGGISSADWKIEHEINKKVFCHTVVKKHQIKNEDGNFVDGILIKEDGEKKIVPFTPENMMKCFSQLSEYYTQVKNYADNYKTFLSSQLEEQEKNS